MSRDTQVLRDAERSRVMNADSALTRSLCEKSFSRLLGTETCHAIHCSCRNPFEPICVVPDTCGKGDLMQIH